MFYLFLSWFMKESKNEMVLKIADLISDVKRNKITFSHEYRLGGLIKINRLMIEINGNLVGSRWHDYGTINLWSDGRVSYKGTDLHPEISSLEGKILFHKFNKYQKEYTKKIKAQYKIEQLQKVKAELKKVS